MKMRIVFKYNSEPLNKKKFLPKSRNFSDSSLIFNNFNVLDNRLICLYF